MLILAIESSCDETAAAVVRDGRQILSNAVASQIDIHALYGGVVPEIASRAHTEAIHGITNEALRDAGVSLNEIDAVAVTNRPGLIGALLVGTNFAKSLAFASHKPLVAVHHIRGHIAANYTYFNGIDREKLEPPFTALVMSGGHTSLIDVSDYTRFENLGVTRDDAAGEAFDKVARLLGLAYPGGAKMDALAKEGDNKAIPFPKANVREHPYDFTFSGLKTHAINYLHTKAQLGEQVNSADMAASFTKAVCDEISRRVELVFKEGACPSKKLVIAGGVSANSHIRARLSGLCRRYGVTLYCPPLSLCGDNAAMIGAAAYYEYLAKPAGEALTLGAYATADVSENNT